MPLERPRPADRHRGLLPALLLGGLLVAAAPAEGVEPMTGGFTPAELLETLVKAVRTDDPQLYADCLADSFRFTPYDGVVGQFPDVDWEHWGRRQELAFAAEWLGPQRSADLLIETILEEGLDSRDRSDWDLVYRLTVDGQEYRSRAVFGFVRIGHSWYLGDWTDTTLESGQNGAFVPTSGTARALLRW